MQRKSSLFLCIPEPQPSLGEAKVVQAERRGKKKTVFPPFPEPQPTFGDSKAQNTPSDDRGKKERDAGAGHLARSAVRYLANR